LTYAGIVSLVYELKDGYHPRAVFFANRLTVAQMRLIVDGIGRPLWEPGMGSEPATFMGYKIYRAADMPLVASNALALAFGDFSRGYCIVDRIGTRILRDPFTQKPFVKFYTTKRVGGAVMNFEAIKLQKIAS
jgi:HK97 family phage major capsid protein